MSKTYNSTEPRRGDTDTILLEKLVQKLGGIYKYGETKNSLLAKVLTLTPDESTTPKRWRAYFDVPTNGSNPNVTVLENNLGVDLVWVRSSAGILSTDYGFSQGLQPWKIVVTLSPTVLGTQHEFRVRGFSDFLPFNPSIHQYENGTLADGQFRGHVTVEFYPL
jgi:hypothetical protein